MSISMLNKKYNILLLFFMFSSIFIQIPIIVLANGISSVKSYHIVIPILFLIILIRLKIVFFKNDVFLFFLFSLISAIINGFIFGFNMLAAQALFCILTYYMAINIAYYIKLTDYYKILKIITIVFVLAVIIKSFYYYEALSMVYDTRQATLSIPFWLVGGGHNLEVTYIAFLAIFFIKRKAIFYILLTIVAFFSIIYLSRIGMIEAVILLFFRLTLNMSKKKIFIVICCIFLVFLLLMLNINFENSSLLDRFINISRELQNTKEGRGMLWFAAFELLQSNLNGYGIGNSILMAEDILNRSFKENNFHNLYLQYLLDLGILPLLVYLYLILKRAIASKIKEFKIFFILFIMISFVQFTGYDVVFWFFLGLHDAINRKLYLQKNQKEVLT